MRDVGFMMENGEAVHIKDTFVKETRKQTRDNSLYFRKLHLGLY